MASKTPLARFTDRVALVTGANDRGIGGAIAERLAEEGASLALVGIEEPQRLARKLKRHEARFTWTECDVTDSSQVDSVIAAAAQEFGRIDVVVNNAGIETAETAENVDDARWQQVLDVNLTGAMRVTRAALPHFTNDGGAIVNIASALAVAGCKGFSAYCASKAGMVGWSQALAWELAPRRIRINCVAPALVATPMAMRHSEGLTEDVWKQLETCHPLGVGTPHDVSAAVAFLASDDARWITGATLPIGWALGFPLPAEQFLAGGE